MSEPVEKKKMPWDGMMDLVQQYMNPVTVKKMPWDGLGLDKPEPYKIPPLKQDKQFETVFSKLIQAESRANIWIRMGN